MQAAYMAAWPLLGMRCVRQQQRIKLNAVLSLVGKIESSWSRVCSLSVSSSMCLCCTHCIAARNRLLMPLASLIETTSAGSAIILIGTPSYDGMEKVRLAGIRMPSSSKLSCSTLGEILAPKNLIQDCGSFGLLPQ